MGIVIVDEFEDSKYIITLIHSFVLFVNLEIYEKSNLGNVNVMRVSSGNSTAVLRGNTANSSLTIDGKFEIINKRIGYVQN